MLLFFIGKTGQNVCFFTFFTTLSFYPSIRRRPSSSQQPMMSVCVHNPNLFAQHLLPPFLACLPVAPWLALSICPLFVCKFPKFHQRCCQITTQHPANHRIKQYTKCCCHRIAPHKTHFLLLLLCGIAVMSINDDATSKNACCAPISHSAHSHFYLFFVVVLLNVV